MTRRDNCGGRRARRIGFLVSMLALLTTAPLHAAICYVKYDAAGAVHDGTTWANAYTDLQSALNTPACQDIYVARGIYKPTSTTDRTISFNVHPGVYLYGGFAGTEASLANRLLGAYPTILSGDIGVGGDASDNSYHVVVMDGTTIFGGISLGSNLFSDFTVRDGNASGAGTNESYGGGLFCNGQGAGHECSPELANLIFENNSAQSGGAIYDDGHAGGKSSPWLHDSIVRDNDTPGASTGGGGMFNAGSGGGVASPLIERVTFSGNSSDLGGAMYNYGLAGISNPTIRNSTFYGNTATSNGGAILNYGASAGHASPVIRYSTFSGNRAVTGNGGAIYNIAPSADAAPNLSGVILWGDQAIGAPVENYTFLSSTVSSLEYSITPECPGGAVGCINANPLLGTLQDNDGFAPTMKPGIGSPAIDAGNAGNCPAVDERGVVRPQGTKCDIGAVELPTNETKRCYVNQSNPSPSTGLSWATAYQNIYPALINGNCTEVWVAKGSYVTNNLLNVSAFNIPPGKQLLGGFAGTETALSQRILAGNETVLDGQGLYRVVAMDATGAGVNIGASTILDGFTITGGSANGVGLQQYGGGLICNGNSGYFCSPTLAHLVFKNNTAVFGGALMNVGTNGGVSSPRLVSVTFSGNHASSNGGAVYDAGAAGVSSPVFSDVVFSGNSAAGNGGAMVNDGGSGGFSRVSVEATAFNDNSATYGGAVFDLDASASFFDVAFTGNSAATNGGALYNYDNAGAQSLQFASASFFGNSASGQGGAIVAGDHSTWLLDHVSFLDNTLAANPAYGGAISAGGGVIVIRDALFVRNGGANVYGGAVYSYAPTLSIAQSAFVGNSALFGGALVATGFSAAGASTTVTDSTFRKNTAAVGGAIWNFGGLGFSTHLDVRNATFAGNAAAAGGGALQSERFDNSVVVATISDSIFWNDSAPSDSEVATLPGSTTTIDHSLIANGCPAGSTCSSVSATDPLLGLLQYYGGFTPALMPAANSPALNAGVNCTQTDQRGVARPQGAACDIGAIERRATEDYLFNNGFDF